MFSSTRTRIDQARRRNRDKVLQLVFPNCGASTQHNGYQRKDLTRYRYRDAQERDMIELAIRIFDLATDAAIREADEDTSTQPRSVSAPPVGNPPPPSFRQSRSSYPARRPRHEMQSALNALRAVEALFSDKREGQARDPSK